jgi:hypothetical protein
MHPQRRFLGKAPSGASQRHLAKTLLALLPAPHQHLQVFVPSTATHLTHHHWPGMDTDAYRQLFPFFLFQARVGRHGNGLDNPHTCMQGTLGIVFVGYQPAEIDAQAIPEVSGHLLFKLVDNSGGGCPVGTDHRTQDFRVERLEACRGVGKIENITLR